MGCRREGQRPMQIELMGCTGAGKTTLVRSIVRTGGARGLDIALGDDVVLGRIGLSGLNSTILRKALLNLIAVSAGLAAWRAHGAIDRFAARALMALPIGPVDKVVLWRSVVKRLGMYEILRRSAGSRVVLVDEGVLQVAHYLFVHASIEPDMCRLHAYARLAPLPDAVVYLRQPEELLTGRTLARGHKRIPGHTHDAVGRFIRRAIATFDTLAQQPDIASRLLIVEGDGTVRAAAPDPETPALAMARRVVQSGIANTLDDQRSAQPLGPLGRSPGMYG